MFCSFYYAGNCTWWLFDETTHYCKIFKGPQEDLYDDCFELGFSSTPSVSECLAPMDPSSNTNCHVSVTLQLLLRLIVIYFYNLIDKDVCYEYCVFYQFFRQDYCRYERDFLDNLEHSHDIDSCQWACQVNPMCNFFTFSKDKSVCMLHRVDIRTRVCDIIHGPPTPSIQSCLDNMAIPWAASSGNLFNLLPKKSFQLNS